MNDEKMTKFRNDSRYPLANANTRLAPSQSHPIPKAKKTTHFTTIQYLEPSR